MLKCWESREEVPKTGESVGYVEEGVEVEGEIVVAEFGVGGAGEVVAKGGGGVISKGVAAPENISTVAANSGDEKRTK